MRGKWLKPLSLFHRKHPSGWLEDSSLVLRVLLPVEQVLRDLGLWKHLCLESEGRACPDWDLPPLTQPHGCEQTLRWLTSIHSPNEETAT